MRLDNFLISSLIFMLVLFVGLMFISDQEVKYDINITDPIITNITAEIGNMTSQALTDKDALEEPTLEVGSEWDSALGGGLGVVLNFWKYIKNIGKLMFQFGSRLGISPVVYGVLYIVILISSIWAVIYMIFRFQPR